MMFNKKDSVFWFGENIKIIQEDDICKENFNIIIILHFPLKHDIADMLIKKKIPIIKYECANKYFIIAENCLYKKEKIEAMETIYTQIWLIPQHVKSCHDYLKIMQKSEIVNVPFIWSPSIIEKFQTLQDLNFLYKKRKKEKDIAIFEPNLGIIKWCMPCIAIAENTYRNICNKNLIRHLWVLNTNSQNVNITNINTLLHSKTFELKNDNKISVEARYYSLKFMHDYADICISHQMENNLNYLYLDLAWCGWPIIHNGNLAKDIGYYYNDYEFEKASKVLEKVINNHDNQSEDYLKRNRKNIDRFLTTNKNVQEEYIKLINKLINNVI